MAQVGLEVSLFDRYPFQLSGGQRQRVLMAMAFGLAPRILIADEPTAGQDVANRDHLLLLLTRLARETGTAVILISHDKDAANALCSRVISLSLPCCQSKTSYPEA